MWHSLYRHKGPSGECVDVGWGWVGHLVGAAHSRLHLVPPQARQTAGGGSVASPCARV